MVGMSDMNGSMKLIGWVGGIVALLITIYATFHVPLSNAIQDTKSYCAAEDVVIRKEITAVCMENARDHGEIKTLLAEIKADLRYLKRNGN